MVHLQSGQRLINILDDTVRLDFACLGHYCSLTSAGPLSKGRPAVISHVAIISITLNELLYSDPLCVL